MSLAILILAAGKSTRMQSATPKVLHEIAGKPMLRYCIEAAQHLKPEKLAIILGEGMENVIPSFHPIPAIIQKNPRGTGHAVQCAREFLSGFVGTVLVLYGDTPFLNHSSLQKMADIIQNGSAVAVMGFHPTDPAQYGRLITNSAGDLTAIVEYADCNEQQKNIGFCNAGIMGFSAKTILPLLNQLQPNNARGELYLTDLVQLAVQNSLRCATITVDTEEVMGINTRAQLASAETVAQNRLRSKFLTAGVTMTDPQSVYFTHDTQIASDVLIEPNVTFGPDVCIESNVHIKAFCHIEGAVIKSGAIVGPFARLRPGTVLGHDVHIGNFVEIKNSELADGVKAGHLSYLGDSTIGSDTNIGAGTITCNYDGFQKHKTTIGAGAFIGSNTALVAPVTVGGGAIIGAGSVITKDVSADALALSRAEQIEKPSWAKRFRDLFIKRRKSG